MRNLDAALTTRRPYIPPPTDNSHCIDEARVCCTQVRSALRCGRFDAANGLLQTALALYQLAACEKLEGKAEEKGAFSCRLDELIDELCFCAQTIEVETVRRDEQTLKDQTLSETMLAFSIREDS